MADDTEFNVDVSRETIRGRVCPVCYGKIIPSNRAVYQSTDPSEVLPLWECERCDYVVQSEKVEPEKKKH